MGQCISNLVPVWSVEEICQRSNILFKVNHDNGQKSEMNKSLVQKDFNNAFSVRMKIRQIRALILCPKQLFNLELKAISNILLRLLLFLLLLVPARANAGVPVKSNIRSFMVVGNNRLHVNWLFHEPTAHGRSGMG